LGEGDVEFEVMEERDNRIGYRDLGRGMGCLKKLGFVWFRENGGFSFKFGAVDSRISISRRDVAMRRSREKLGIALYLAD
jgi:hypothetical protein